MQRKALSVSLLALLCASFASGVHAQCVPSTAVSASIGLIDQPYPYEDLEPELTPTQIAALPDRGASMPTSPRRLPRASE
jgi:hypothetical protein